MSTRNDNNGNHVSMPHLKRQSRVSMGILLPLFTILMIIIIQASTFVLITGQENTILMANAATATTPKGNATTVSNNNSSITGPNLIANNNFTKTTELVSPIAEDIIICPNSIDVDPGSRAYNSTHIKCVEETLKTCKLSDMSLLYGLGSMRLSIQGQKNDLCVIEIVHEIEMGVNQYSCSVPFDKVLTWTSWKKGGGTGALEDISAFCKSMD